MCRIATSSLRRPSAAKERRLGKPRRAAKPSEVRPLTCQNRSRSATPSRPARPAKPRSVNGPSIRRCPTSSALAGPTAAGAGPCQVFEPRKVVQQRQAGIGDEAAGAEPAQVRFAGERLDRAVAGWRSHQVHLLEPFAEPQVGHPRVAHAALPGHLEPAQVRQVPEHLEAAIRQPPAGILAEIELLQLRHARQVQQAVVGELPRSTERQRGDVIELRNPREDVVGHQAAGVERGDAAFLHHRDQPVPFPIAQLPLRRDAILSVRRSRRRGQRAHRCASRPAAPPSCRSPRPGPAPTAPRPARGSVAADRNARWRNE